MLSSSCAVKVDACMCNFPLSCPHFSLSSPPPILLNVSLWGIKVENKHKNEQNVLVS